MTQDPIATVRYTGGPLSGATLELPAELADAHPSRLVITVGGTVYDRHRQCLVNKARVVELPTAQRPESRKPVRRRRA